MLDKNRKSALVILLILVSCSFWLLANAAEPPALAKLSGAEKARVAKLIEGAKKERILVGYSQLLRPDVQAALLPKFRAWYGLSESDLEIKIVSIRSDALVAKVTEELRANVHVTDLVNCAAINWFNDLVARGELMPYDSPEYKHFSPRSVNPEIAPSNPPYFISGVFNIQFVPYYNPKHMKGEILHWKDALRPEYKGKISVGDVSNSASYTEGYIALRKILDAGFFKGLAKQDPFVLVSASDLVNKVIAGEFPIALVSCDVAYRANVAGANLKLAFPPEGVPVVGNPTAILTHAPHPNAAKLFIDFFHSEAAQTTLLYDGYPVGRLGIKSKDSNFPRPIYDIEGVIPLDWRKLTTKDRDNAREEFRRLVIDKK